MRVGVLGARGIVGQQYLALLKNRPEYEVVDIQEGQPPLIFSCLPNEAARELEPKLAKEGKIVISSASTFRGDPDIPVIIPEVNSDHLEILHYQRRKRGYAGAIIAKPNCSLQGFVIPLSGLPVKQILVTTMQAMSGAGKKGLAAMDIMDNIIPYIAEEEEKTENEPQKIWGEVGESGIILNQMIQISSQCHRVPVLDGHLASISFKLADNVSEECVTNHWKSKTYINYCEGVDRPQPRLDRMAGGGMQVSVGRLRPCPILDYKFTALSHNAIRGAAGGGIAIADLLIKKGILHETESELSAPLSKLPLS